MVRLIRVSIILAIVISMVTSCKVEKRVYRKGYHVVWNHHHSKESKKHEKLNTEIQTAVSEALYEKEVVSANTAREADLISPKRTPILILNNDTCGDVLLLQSADELHVKILEIDEQTIKYKRCDNLNGPTFTINKNKVALIKYANGTKEVIMQEPPAKTQIQRNGNAPEMPRKLNLLGLVSLLLYILGTILSRGSVFTGLNGSIYILLALLAIAPLVMAYISLFQFKREPEKYKGRWMPITVVIFYLATLLILTLMIVALITAYGGVSGVGFFVFVAVALIFFLLLLGILIAALIPKAQPKTNGKQSRQ